MGCTPLARTSTKTPNFKANAGETAEIFGSLFRSVAR
jgi:hypothetical protein